MKEWISRIYNEENPDELNTLYGQLARIATNRAVYLSIIKMTEESKIEMNELIINFITDGYNSDLVMTMRRLVESNKNKSKNKKVNSIMGLVEDLKDEELLATVKIISKSIGDAPNKVYGHNDLMYHDGEKKLILESYNTFDNAIKELFKVLNTAALSLNVYLPDSLVATNQFDWAVAFDKPWRKHGFDDSNIWSEL